jgi:hypothetical protein
MARRYAGPRSECCLDYDYSHYDRIKQEGLKGKTPEGEIASNLKDVR